MRVVLEVLRVLCLLIILGGIGSYILYQVYAELDTSFTWFGFFGVILFIFVLYRNKLQFSGWYKGENRKRLSRKATTIINFTAVLCIISPIVFEIIAI